MKNIFCIVLKNEGITHKVQESLNQLQHHYSFSLTTNLLAIKREHGPTNVYPVLIIELTESINFNFWGMLVDIAFSNAHIDEIIAIQSDEKIHTNNFYNHNKQELMHALAEMKCEDEYIDIDFTTCKNNQYPNYKYSLNSGTQHSANF